MHHFFTHKKSTHGGLLWILSPNANQEIMVPLRFASRMTGSRMTSSNSLLPTAPKTPLWTFVSLKSQPIGSAMPNFVGRVSHLYWLSSIVYSPHSGRSNSLFAEVFHSKDERGSSWNRTCAATAVAKARRHHEDSLFAGEHPLHT